MIFFSYSYEEAIMQAEAFFQCSREQLEVLETKLPSKKLLGIVKKKGEFEIVLREAVPDEPVTKNEVLNDSDGFIEVAEGKVIINDPKSDGRAPALFALNPQVEIFINDVKIEDKVVVNSTDKIEIKFINEEPSLKVKAWLSEDKLEAYLQITRVHGRNYFLKNILPTLSAAIDLDFAPVEPELPSMDECISELRKIGVDMRFINTGKIADMLNKKEPKYTVAEGIAPVHGIDSKIVYLFNNDNYRNPDFDTDKKINLMDHTIIPDVKIGDVLAIKSQPAIPGKDGVAVTGAVIKAKQGIDIPLKVGNGAKIEENKIVSLLNGRPTYKYGVVSVVPTLIISNNISVETGNVNFDGDLVIKGNVEENLKVTANGDIKIHGNVYHGTVCSKGSIQIRGHVLNSRICAGVSMVKYLCINPLLKQILGIIKSMSDSMDNLEKSQGYINSKYQMRQSVIQNKEQLDNIFHEISVRQSLLSDDKMRELETLLKDIKNTLSGVKAKCIEDVGALQSVNEIIRKYISDTESFIDGESDINIKYTQSSHVEANGKIFIEEKGSFQSNLIAKDSIIFQNASSIVRGGTLIAGNYIKMKNVGTSAGSTTYCKVINNNGSIDADDYSNVVIDVGGNIKTMK